MECLLGDRGVSAKNDVGECELQGRFDVWLMEDNRLLVSDLGFPSEEPKQCLALGVREGLAKRIAEEKSLQLATEIATSERKCLSCRRIYWISDHETSVKQVEIAKGYFCPTCIGKETEETMVRKLGNLGYWCG
jgi:hypothetical protein